MLWRSSLPNLKFLFKRRETKKKKRLCSDCKKSPTLSKAPVAWHRKAACLAQSLTLGQKDWLSYCDVTGNCVDTALTSPHLAPLLGLTDLVACL